MLNDGGAFDPSNTTMPACIVNSVLRQRVRMFEFITMGLSCALLRGTTFRDSKVSRYQTSYQPNFNNTMVLADYHFHLRTSSRPQCSERA